MTQLAAASQFRVAPGGRIGTLRPDREPEDPWLGTAIMKIALLFAAREKKPCGARHLVRAGGE